jgi:hypothetical protein
VSQAPDAMAAEVELRRRLGDLATLAVVDDDAWETFQRRLAGAPTSRRRVTPKRVLAVAAAIVVLAGVLILARQDDGGRVRTVDDTTTTTDGGRTATTSTTRPDGRTTTSTGPGDVPGGGTAGGGGGPGGGGTGSGTGTGAAGGAGAPGSQPGAPGGPAGPGGSSGTTAPPQAAPGGPAPAVTFTTPEYTLEATFEVRGTTFIMNIWRVGGSHVSDWVAGDQPGHNCLRGKNAIALSFPEPGPHLYSWGIVRSDAAEVRVVTNSGDWTTAVIGSEVAPGIRAWIARRYTEQISRFEALDSAGNVLHTAQWETPEDTC